MASCDKDLLSLPRNSVARGSAPDFSSNDDKVSDATDLEGSILFDEFNDECVLIGR